MNALETLLSLKGKDIEVCKIESGKILVEYRGSEVKEGMFLVSCYGVGKTFYEACEDYLNKLHGKILVFGAGTSRREEVRVL
ncbi:hypothetical protein [Acutalibacter sp. 1XD8-36]|uniref:hypothetical protein n=1 Tax=Acutalibacter sp. 1XD8-36 TaxID=2320852 RepID=UPI00141241A6|nr:hypothetical protein [Acutalibacter sp. 1XD8-36]NBJ89855.1 hypothetical protein [Acutalibacter sp. 1XD8-36]